MKASILVALAAMAFAPYACSGDPDDTPTPKVEVRGTEKVGSLSLDLLGTDTAGQAYRLRNAIFQLYPYYYPYPPDDGGFGNLTLSSETDPDATSVIAQARRLFAIDGPGTATDPETKADPSVAEAPARSSQGTESGT